MWLLGLVVFIGHKQGLSKDVVRVGVEMRKVCG